jgi:hypothetical protein
MYEFSKKKKKNHNLQSGTNIIYMAVKLKTLVMLHTTITNIERPCSSMNVLNVKITNSVQTRIKQLPTVCFTARVPCSKLVTSLAVRISSIPISEDLMIHASPSLLHMSVIRQAATFYTRHSTETLYP